MRKLLYSLAALCLCAAASAQALPALLIPTEGRSLAMGGVSEFRQAKDVDASAFFGIWAPQTVSSTMLGADVKFKVGEKLAITGGLKNFSDKAYDITEEVGGPTSTFKPSDFLLTIGTEYSITESILAGLRLGTVSSTIAKDVTGSAFCIDIYGRFIKPTWSIGAAGRNIGSSINYGYGDYALPSYMALDGNWSPIKGLTVAAEADYLFSGAIMASAGAEYGIADMAFLRAGFHYGDEQKALPTFLSLGVGGKFGGFRIDAAMLLLSKTLNTSFTVSLGYSF